MTKPYTDYISIRSNRITYLGTHTSVVYKVSIPAGLCGWWITGNENLCVCHRVLESPAVTAAILEDFHLS